MSVFHDEVEIEDFEYEEDEETYYYPCPCGDRLGFKWFDIVRLRVLFISLGREGLRDNDNLHLRITIIIAMFNWKLKTETLKLLANP